MIGIWGCLYIEVEIQIEAFLTNHALNFESIL